jgi:hypothetical protein
MVIAARISQQQAQLHAPWSKVVETRRLAGAFSNYQNI